MSGETLACAAPAKLNLFLHVTGRRADGYHLLQTLFRFLDHGDTLTFAVREDGLIRHLRPIPGVPAEQDLCVRAARMLQAETGTGLGGGSSDAATVLLALNRLWRLGLSRSDLQALGLRLGADVPVFVFGQAAFAEGIGEALRPVQGLPAAWYLVLVPPVSVPTAAVFSDPELTRNSDPIKILGFSAGVERTIAYGALAEAAGGLGGGVGRNDLEAVVCRKYAAVAAHLRWLREQAPAAMSGSGACVFAVFDNEAAATRAYRSMPQGMQGFVARGIDRHPLYDWA